MRLPPALVFPTLCATLPSFYSCLTCSNLHVSVMPIRFRRSLVNPNLIRIVGHSKQRHQPKLANGLLSSSSMGTLWTKAAVHFAMVGLARLMASVM